MVNVTYQSLRATEPTTYDIYPYGFAYHRNALYVVGWAPRREQIRIWKVDRIEEAHLEDLRFQRPADFDLDEHFAKAFGICVHRDCRRLHGGFDVSIGRLHE